MDDRQQTIQEDAKSTEVNEWKQRIAKKNIVKYQKNKVKMKKWMTDNRLWKKMPKARGIMSGNRG